MSNMVKEISNYEKELVSHYVNEWNLLSQYINDIDRGYGNFITIFSAVITILATVVSGSNEMKYVSTVFYLIPLASIVVFGYMGYQFRIVAILRGHLARIEDEINAILGEDVYMWNSSLVEVYMAHNNVPNNTLIIPILMLILFINGWCFVETLCRGMVWFNTVFWIIAVALAILVFVPYLLNGIIRKKTYKKEDVIEKYKSLIEKEKRRK